MKKVLVVIFAAALAIGFGYVIDADAKCGMMGGGCGMGSGCGMSGGCGMGGCGMSEMKGGCGMGGCGMSHTSPMKGACGTPGCICGAGCAGAGCACGSMPGMGGHGAGHGMGNPMMKVFLEETKELRKELHMKKFEYNEAARDFDVSVEDLMKMEKEIQMLEMKINRYWLK